MHLFRKIVGLAPDIQICKRVLYLPLWPIGQHNVPRNTEDVSSIPGRDNRGLDDHLKWRSSVIGSYAQWQAKEPQGHGEWSSLGLGLSVREVSVTRMLGLYFVQSESQLCPVHNNVHFFYSYFFFKILQPEFWMSSFFQIIPFEINFISWKF